MGNFHMLRELPACNCKVLREQKQKVEILSTCHLLSDICNIILPFVECYLYLIFKYVDYGRSALLSIVSLFSLPELTVFQKEEIKRTP